MPNAREIGRQLMSDLKRDFGLTDAQAAGVVGNLLHESANFGSMQERSPQSGRGGFGYAQWTGSRRREFESYVKRNDLDPDSYEANYGFLKHEVTTVPYERKNFNKVKKATTASQAARIISDEYLRPGVKHNDRRVRLANQALELRSGPPGTPATIPAALRSRMDPSAVAAIEAAAGTSSGAQPELSYADMPRSLNAAVKRVQETTMPARRTTPDEGMIADSLSSIARANPQGRATQVHAADLDAANANPTAFLTRSGTGVTDAAQIALFGDNPDYLSIGSLPTSGARAAPRQRTELAQTFAGQERAPQAPVRSAPPMRTGVAQSYAGQERNPPAASRSAVSPASTRTAADVGTFRAANDSAGAAPAPAQQSSQLFGSRTAASIPEVQEAVARAAAAVPRAPQRLPEMPPSTLGTAAVTPASTRAAADLRAMRAANQQNTDAERNRTTVAVIPTTGVGAAPRTRPVTTTPVAPTQTEIQRQAEIYRQGGPTRTPNSPSAFGAFPQGGAQPLTSVAQPNGSVNPNKRSDRLRTAGLPLVEADPIVAPVPRPASARPYGVGTQLAVTPPPQRVAPIPFARPNFGIGGPDLIPANGPMPIVAPPRDMEGIANMILAATPLPQIIEFLSPKRVAPVGAFLGTAANGGTMIQGYGGIGNSTTQLSNAWRAATGDSSADDYRSGGDHDKNHSLSGSGKGR